MINHNIQNVSRNNARMFVGVSLNWDGMIPNDCNNDIQPRAYVVMATENGTATRNAPTEATNTEN